MAPSNNASEPTERTSLLSKDIPKQIGPSLSDTITASDSNVNGYGSVFKSGDEDAVDEETGEVEEQVNPLYEGRPDVNMGLLFPAVALGVSCFSFHLHLCLILNPEMGG